MENETYQEENLEEKNQEQEEIQEEPQEEKEEIDVEALKKENETLKAQKSHWKKKAEAKTEEPVKAEAKEESKAEVGFNKDQYALLKAGIGLDDVETVQRIAKALDMSVAEALDSNITKTVLKEAEETRKTAEAANTKTSRRGTAEVTGETLLKNANDGKMPETDEDIIKLWKTRKGLGT